ncbi:prion-inhibition and propagation-domain-containing protein [Usnea florida]
MDPASAGLGIVAAVIQIYNAVTTAYNLYLEIQDFPSTYQEMRMGLLIERYRLQLWASHVLSEYEQNRVRTSMSSNEWGLWKLFESIFNKILETFQEHNEIMESYGQQTGVAKKDELSDWELLENISLAVKSSTKSTKGIVTSISRTVKFVLRDKKKLEQLIKKLNYWNDSLDKMTSRPDQESSRRRLRTHLSTGDTTQLQCLEAAAALFQHKDLQRMASARNLIEQDYYSEPLHQPDIKTPKLTSETPCERTTSARNAIELDGPTEYHPHTGTPSFSPIFRLEMGQLQFQGIPYQTDQVRAVAKLGQEDIIVDWRGCQDDTWRRENPAAFRRRTEHLTKILNTDLRPLGISVLHCIGYLDQNINVTGYVFRIPQDAQPGQTPVTLHQVLTRTTKPNDIPDLGERFDLAKALISTVFEIHNIGWMHKNINSKNVLFWPKLNTKDEPNLRRPYLIGFDISRPNQPGEVSEKPLSRPEDDLYRHPDYKGPQARSFQPSFDMYSLGVMLYEIGLWRNVAQQRQSSGSRPSLQTHRLDPDFIEKMVMSGPIGDLKRYMGIRYGDAVKACLSRDFDALGEKQEGDKQAQLRIYLDEVQTKVVDAIALCSA